MSFTVSVLVLSIFGFGGNLYANDTKIINIDFGGKAMTDNKKCNICGKPADKHEGGLFCCPFCERGTGIMAYENGFIVPMWHFVKCRKCGARGASSETLEGGAGLWNTRPDPWTSVEDGLPEADFGKYLVIRKSYEDEPEISGYLADVPCNGGCHGWDRGMPVLYWRPIDTPGGE